LPSVYSGGSESKLRTDLGRQKQPRTLFVDERFRVSSGGIRLAFNRLPSAFQQPNLKTAHDYQQEIEYPRTPVKYVAPERLLLVGERNGRQAGEFYGVLFILACYGFAMWIGGTGLYRFVDEGRRWNGGFLIALALTLALIGTLSGGFDRLPWHWGQSSRQHSEYRQTFQHDGENVSQKHLDYAMFL
jgi:hypothetical protein